MNSFGSAITALCGVESGRPRLTWYGSLGQRVELSGAVLRQWAAKASNVFSEDLGTEAGSTFFVEETGHWLEYIAALGQWCLGAELTVRDADVLITSMKPQSFAGDVVAVATAPMALNMPNHVEAWWDMDFVAAARGGADQALYDADETPAAPVAATGWHGERLLIPANSTWGKVDNLAALLLAGNSLVLVAETSDDLTRIAESERVTQTLE